MDSDERRQKEGLARSVVLVSSAERVADLSFFFFLGGEFTLVVLPSLCGGSVFDFAIPLWEARGYWVGGVCCAVFLMYFGVAFPLVPLMIFPLSLEGAVALFPILASSPGLVGGSPFLKFFPPLI